MAEAGKPPRHPGVNAAHLGGALNLPTNEAVGAAVAAGMGASAVSAIGALEAEFQSRISVDLAGRLSNLVRHAERHLSDAGRALVATLPGGT